MSISGRCLATGVPAPVVGRQAGPLRGVLRLQDRNIAAQQCRAHLKPNTSKLAASRSVIRRRSDRLQSVRVTASSAAISQSSEAPSEPPFKWGANMKNLGICVAVATIVWFVPPPAGVELKAWRLLAIFLGTIVGIITQPLPLGAVAMLGLGASMLTKILTFPAAFSAFASEIP